MKSSTLSDSYHSKKEPRVVVLMSTFNGDKYVVEQLESILNQLPTSGRIMVRDDGSTDDTIAAVKSVQDDRVKLIQGINIGFGPSFLTLLLAAPSDADMVMFSDQDDVWLPCKIKRAWAHINKYCDRPALYGSAQMLVDERLKCLQSTQNWPRGPSFVNALTENIITGCTAALNKPALTLLQRAGVPSRVYFHDWWLYLVVSAFGVVIYDHYPTLLYRQHGRNVIGRGSGWLARQWGVVKFLLQNDWVAILTRQVSEFRSIYKDILPLAKLDMLNIYFPNHELPLSPRWRIIFSRKRWRQFLIGDIALRILVGLHKTGLWPVSFIKLNRRG